MGHLKLGIYKKYLEMIKNGTKHFELRKLSDTTVNIINQLKANYSSTVILETVEKPLEETTIVFDNYGVIAIAPNDNVVKTIKNNLPKMFDFQMVNEIEAFIDNNKGFVEKYYQKEKFVVILNIKEIKD